MFVGAQGAPPLDLFVLTMVGLALACGGASALNHLLDRDIDALMGSRTEQRPVASGRVSPGQALEFGLVLSALVRAARIDREPPDGGARARRKRVLRRRLHALAEALDAAEHRHRRRGRGRSATRRLRGGDGSLALPALWLFLIVFLWTPPHFWALALMIKRAYAAAGSRCCPSSAARPETARQIVLYSVALVAFTLVVGYWLGPVYTAAEPSSVRSLSCSRCPAPRSPRAGGPVLFHYSLAYLALLFVAAALRSASHMTRDRPLAQESALRLGALRPLLPALRGDVPHGAPVSPAGLIFAQDRNPLADSGRDKHAPSWGAPEPETSGCEVARFSGHQSLKVLRKTGNMGSRNRKPRGVKSRVCRARQPWRRPVRDVGHPSIEGGLGVSGAEDHPCGWRSAWSSSPLCCSSPRSSPRRPRWRRDRLLHRRAFMDFSSAPTSR